ncbi:hypothetical protein GEMRC1_004589 [Eukaryota sp. GEM-RC1]
MNCFVLLVLLIGVSLAGRECELCHTVVSTTVPFHVRNALFAEFFMKTACDRIDGLSSEERTHCKKFVDKHKDNLMDWIQNSKVEEKLCTEAVKKCGTDSDENQEGKKIMDHLKDLIPVFLQSDRGQKMTKDFCKHHHSDLDLSKEECLTFMITVQERAMKIEDMDEVLCSILHIC